MAMEQTLVPAFVSVTYGGTELNIIDAKFSLKYDNGTKFEKCMAPSHSNGYLLSKGISIRQEGDMFVTITKTNDGKQDDNIKFLQDKKKAINSAKKPAEYAESIVITCKDPGEQQFLNVSFSGYIKEIKTLPTKKGNEFISFMAEFEIFDPLTIKIEN